MRTLRAWTGTIEPELNISIVTTSIGMVIVMKGEKFGSMANDTTSSLTVTSKHETTEGVTATIKAIMIGGAMIETTKTGDVMSKQGWTTSVEQSNDDRMTKDVEMIKFAEKKISEGTMSGDKKKLDSEIKPSGITTIETIATITMAVEITATEEITETIRIAEITETIGVTTATDAVATSRYVKH
jgi:hypothetical protein